MVTVTERGYRDSCLGRVLQVKVWAPGYPLLSWRQVYDAFSEHYPGKWAVQFFPPSCELVDSKAVYHLWVLDVEPWGLNLR